MNGPGKGLSLMLVLAKLLRNSYMAICWTTDRVGRKCLQELLNLQVGTDGRESGFKNPGPGWTVFYMSCLEQTSCLER